MTTKAEKRLMKRATELAEYLRAIMTVGRFTPDEIIEALAIVTVGVIGVSFAGRSEMEDEMEIFKRRVLMTIDLHFEALQEKRAMNLLSVSKETKQ